MTALLPFSPTGNRPQREFDLSELVQEVCGLLESEGLSRGVSIEADSPPHTIIQADRVQLGRALEHLLTIILADSPARSDIVLTTISDEDGVELEVAGGGSISYEHGQSDDPLEDISLVDARWQESWSDFRRIIAESEAEISIAKCPEGGIACTIYFPHCRDEDASSRKAA